MALRLNGSSSGYVELDVPADAGSHTLTLPNSGGSSGQYLQTNGSGGLSWVTPAGGKILQVVKNQKLDVASATTTSAWTSFTGCTVTITPTDSGNRVFGFFSFSHGASTFHHIRNFRVVRGSTVVSDVATGVTVQSTISRLRDQYDANGANYPMLVFEDDLTGYTSGSITYTLQYYATQAGTYYINRSSNDTAEWGRGASTFVAVEVAA